MEGSLLVVVYTVEEALVVIVQTSCRTVAFAELVASELVASAFVAVAVAAVVVER